MKAILTALRSRIVAGTNPTQFYGYLGTRVFLDSAPGDTVLPLCVYSAETTTFQRTMDNTERHVVSVMFTVYETQEQCTYGMQALAYLRTWIDGYTLSPTGYDRALCILRSRGAPSFDGENWSISDRYEIIGQRITTTT
jgi:hypothetical protein